MNTILEWLGRTVLVLAVMLIFALVIGFLIDMYNYSLLGGIISTIVLLVAGVIAGILK